MNRLDPLADHATILPSLDCSFSRNSPAAAGMVARLLAWEDPLPQAFRGACVRLCGHSAVFSCAFTSQSQLLLLLQCLHSVEDLVTSGTAAEGVRREVEMCVEWLYSLEVYCHRFVSLQPEAERGAGGVAERLLAWLRVVVGHLQPLDQLLLSSPHQQPCGCHLTRLSLHIHWTAVSVTLRLSHVAGWQWFLEQARLTLSCLLSHAASIGPASVSSLLGCSCLRELWLLLRYSLDHSPASSFWSVVNSIVHEATSPQPHFSASLAGLSLSDPVLFGWWSVQELAQLYCYSIQGELTVAAELVPNWELVHHLLPLTFRQGASESQLRSGLRACLSLARLWPASLSPLPCLSAWDYFHKHIDDHLLAGPAATITDWTSAEWSSSPSHWTQHLVSLLQSATAPNPATAEPHPATAEPHLATEELNSFQLFLCLICVTMATRERDKLWKQLKGRFYSKLHRRWLCERKGAGLQRVLSLLLTLTWSGDGNEVAMRTVSLLSQSGLAELGESSPLLWRGVFAQFLLLVKKRERLNSIIVKLQPDLKLLVRPHPPEYSDLQRRAVDVVLDGTVEVVEAGLGLGAENLIGSHLTDLLTSVESGRLNRVLRLIETLVTILTSSPTPHCTASQLLWQHCSQPLLSLAHLPVFPTSLPSTLAALTTLTTHQSHTHQHSPSLFLELTTDSIAGSLTASYLGHVIESDITRHHLLSTSEPQIRVLHVWFRCLAELDHTPSATPTSQSSTFLQLTDQLPKLSIVSSLLGNHTLPSDTMQLFKILLVAMETAYVNQEADWREWLRQMLGDVVHYLEPSVVGVRGPAAVRHSYHVAGLVVAMAPRLTYSRTESRCLLPRLLDWLALPLLSTHRPQPPGTSAAVRAHLHLFLGGLLQLEPVRDEFIKRKVKQLFSRYFHDCCQPRSPLLASSENPFLLALRPWFDSSCHGDGEPVKLVMEVVVAQSLCPPLHLSSLSPTLQFIKSVVQKVQNPSVLVTLAPTLTSHMISCLLLCDISQSDITNTSFISNCVMDILRPLLMSCKDQNQLPCSLLLPCLTDYISRHQSSVKPAILARPLQTVGRLYPDLLQLLTTQLSDDWHTRHLLAHLVDNC